MKKANFPGIRGFEWAPEGKLLTQKVDFSGPIGIAYERCIGYLKPDHSHERITITFPRGSSRSLMRTLPDATTFQLSSDLFHIMPKDQRHEQGSFSTIYDTFALFVTPEYYTAHLTGRGVAPREIKTFLASNLAIIRSAILSEAIDRYFASRILATTPSPVELQHLESILLTEIFLLAAVVKSAPADGGAEANRKTKLKKTEMPASEDRVLQRALRFIECHLFEKLDLATLVRSSHTSQASLFRIFQREIGTSPIEYIRRRRLDEAHGLLKTGQHSIGDVALLIGYEDLGAFSKAFKKHFGKNPSLIARG